MRLPSERVAKMGIWIALGLIFSYVESQIPVVLGVPGIKLGLANLLVLMVLYRFGLRWALLCNIIRIVLAGLLFGNAIGIMYSLCGAACSIAAMFLLYQKEWLSIAGVSMLGAIFHNIGQILIAGILLSFQTVWIYIPYLMISAVIMGLLIGNLTSFLLKKNIV